jgi:hypothetical protein
VERYCGGVCFAIARLIIRQMAGPSRFAAATPKPMMRRVKTSITTIILCVANSWFPQNQQFATHNSAFAFEHYNRFSVEHQR